MNAKKATMTDECMKAEDAKMNAQEKAKMNAAEASHRQTHKLIYDTCQMKTLPTMAAKRKATINDELMNAEKAKMNEKLMNAKKASTINDELMNAEKAKMNDKLMNAKKATMNDELMKAEDAKMNAQEKAKMNAAEDNQRQTHKLIYDKCYDENNTDNGYQTRATSMATDKWSTVPRFIVKYLTNW